MPLKLLPALLALAASLLASACRPAPPPPPIRIGVVTYKPSDLNGPDTSNAAQLAVDEVNGMGGVVVSGRARPVELRVVTIDEESSEQAVAATERLLNQEGVEAIIGPQNSDEAIPAAGLANRAGVPLLSPLASHSLVTKDRPFAFRVCYGADAQGRALASFALETLKVQTAAILVQYPVVYSREIADRFRKEFVARGGRIVADEGFASDSDDLTRQVENVRKSRADVLLLPNYANVSVKVGIRVRQAGISSIFLGSDAWSRRLVRSRPEFNGSYMVTNWSKQLQTPANEAFVGAYTRRFKDEPGETAALTYDAMRLVFAAMATTKAASAVEVRDALHAMPGFDGVSGRIQYGGSGDPEKPVVVLSFNAGVDAVARVITTGPPR